MTVSSSDLIPVEVAYATSSKQHLLSLDLPEGSTIKDAIVRSGILETCPEIDLAAARVGVWGKLASLEHQLKSRDRAEIYRPLKADPKEARRRRASDQAAG